MYPAKIAILAIDDPSDVRTWSGVPYFMTRELRCHFESVEHVPCDPPAGYDWQQRLNRWSHRILRRQFVPGETRRDLERRMARLSERVRAAAPDLVLSITVDQQVAFLETDVPVVHHSDTTFAGLEGYYPQYTGLWGFARELGHDVCRRALANATLTVYPSHWAAASAVEHYDADPDAIRVVPYGANLEQPPAADDAVRLDERNTCRLLFVGGDWKRKGGPVALAILEELVRRGVDAELVVVGCDPTERHDRLTVHPFLNKQIQTQLDTYLSLWRSSAFFVLPSRQETFGAVFCEAAAHGLPAIATATGGIGDAVEHGVSGYLLSPRSDPAEYADVIERVWGNREGYTALVRASRDRFDRVLNWSSWGNEVAKLIQVVLERRNRRGEVSHGIH